MSAGLVKSISAPSVFWWAVKAMKPFALPPVQLVSGMLKINDINDEITTIMFSGNRKANLYFVCFQSIIYAAAKIVTTRKRKYPERMNVTFGCKDQKVVSRDQRAKARRKKKGERRKVLSDEWRGIRDVGRVMSEDSLSFSVITNKNNIAPSEIGVIINIFSNPGKAFDAVPITAMDNRPCAIFE